MDNATTTEQLLKTFSALKPKQEIKVSIKAVMGHGASETGTYTPYVVGRRSKSAKYGVESVSLKNADGSKMHPMRKITLMKRNDFNGQPTITIAIGDMGARLIGIITE